MVKSHQYKRIHVLCLGREVPREKEVESTPTFLPGNPMDRGALWAIVHGVARVRHNLETKQQHEV